MYICLLTAYHISSRIPGFTEHNFPDASRPYLSLVTNIGLCIFLFLVGLEIDAGVVRRNASLSATVALAGMVLPFGIGSGPTTAFLVLWRILTELKLLDTTVGIVVLSAGVGNDIGAQLLLPLLLAITNHLLQSVGRC